MRFFLILSLFLYPFAALANPTCEDFFRFETRISELDLAHKIESEANQSPLIQKAFGKKARGFAVITATMVASAALSTHLTSELPKDMAFLSALVGQISTIGIFVLGAPIWQPISSALHKFAFGLSAEKSEMTSDPALERLWQQTQARYSQNAQMSRNLIQSFLLATHANFSTAREAMREGRETLAIDQIAETAVRLRRLFSEIDPTDASVSLAVQSTFTRHVEDPQRLKAFVLNRIERDDPEFRASSVRLYYETLIQTWLLQDETSSPR